MARELNRQSRLPFVTCSVYLPSLVASEYINNKTDTTLEQNDLLCE